MQIEHIFNAIHRNNENNLSFSPQKFEVDFIEHIIFNTSTQQTNYDGEDDYFKLYNKGLYPAKQSIISQYDDEKIDNLLEELGEEIVMISGDFWGIQKFIFEDLTTKKASKILRSRSAMVELITYVIIDILKREFKGDKVLFGAGKFLFLAKKENDYKDKILKIQKEIDNYFLENFFGQNGFILSFYETTKEKLQNQDSEEMKSDLISLGKDNELKKLNKFNLKDIDEDKINIDVFKTAKNDDDICDFCKKRIKSIIVESDEKKEKACEICHNQIILGEKLTKKRYIKIFTSKKQESKDKVLIFKYKDTFYYAKFFNEIVDDLDVFDISNQKFEGISKWPLGAFVAKENNKIKSFEELQGNSQGLIAMKADVDRLGDTFRDFYMTSFKKFNRLSRELNFFFSNYLPYFIENSEYKDKVYVIFAGGDDLFLIGEYKTMIKLAKDIRDRFYKFAIKKATLSMGLVMFKHSTPINYISHLADEAEKRAKEVTEGGANRNGIDIFGISMKFDTFINIENRWGEIVEELETLNIDTTTFYYRLLELCDMRENLKSKSVDIKNAMWKSKLRYLYSRNLKSLSEESYGSILGLIDKYGIKLKPSIYLTIYHNREKENKK